MFFDFLAKLPLFLFLFVREYLSDLLVLLILVITFELFLLDFQYILSSLSFLKLLCLFIQIIPCREGGMKKLAFCLQWSLVGFDK